MMIKLIKTKKARHKRFAEVLSNYKEQSIDEHMVKFKERSGMKQYIESKPIK